MLNLTSGGELDLTSGGVAYIERLLHVDADSIITGDGEFDSSTTTTSMDAVSISAERFAPT